MDEPPAVGFEQIANELAFTSQQVENVTALLDAGNTVPFITRYRKEQTANLDEVQIRKIQQRVTGLRQLADRAKTILRLIDAQQKLTPDLRRAIDEADTLKRLEDLYLPFRPKRRSRAMQARERGLEPLAEGIWSQDQTLNNLQTAAVEFINSDNDLPETADVLRGAADILAERISEDAEIRQLARKIAGQTGKLTVTAAKTDDEHGQEYRDYFDFAEAISRIPPHRSLAINRGEKAGMLRVKFGWDQDRAKAAVTKHLKLAGHRFASFLENCVADALGRLIQPSLERELRRELTERAERHAVAVFARNLKNLLLRPPLQGQRVVSIDPGFRTGCKLAALDEFGNCLARDVIYVTGSAEKRTATRQKLVRFLQEHDCTLVAIGNGTACRETEELVSEIVAEQLSEVRYVIVNEAGASIYSTSNVAREEFPEFDATVRGTISIGRRLQDPLSELVKIDPQHIGVGMYQHDVNPRLLKESLDQVVESCVNYVGVDLNTASASLLRHVSGFNQSIARRVVAQREKNGRFAIRRQLLDVAGIGEATYTQAAGFLKITGGDEPLDATWIHPESYESARKLLGRLDLSPTRLIAGDLDASQLQNRLSQCDPASLANELNVGLPTFQDILDALLRPGRDPRTDLPGTVFKQGILKLDDLSKGMELTGTVLNVVDFGVFVDVGLKDSGLVHISQMADRYVKNPHEIACVGNVVTVWVLGVDHQRRRISLTMINPASVRDSQDRKPNPPVKSPSQQKSKSPNPELTSDKIAGRKPLTGFDELKNLWGNSER